MATRSFPDPATAAVSFGTPALTLGTANAAGVADTAIRTDATIVAFDATAPAAVDGAAAAVGTAALAARRDHVHLLGPTITNAITLSAAGTALTVNNNATITGTATVGTLAATTINGAAMSGTFTGAHTYSGALTLSGGPLTWSVGVAITATSYQVGRDADATNTLHFNVPTGASFEWSINDVATLLMTSANLAPAVNNGLALGVATVAWADLFLATGALINFNNGNLTLTHSAGAMAATGAWTFSGASVSITATTGNTLIVDTTTLVVDATNNRVGIGTSVPTALLHISAGTPESIWQSTNQGANAQKWGVGTSLLVAQDFVFRSLNDDDTVKNTVLRLGGANEIGLYGVAPAARAAAITNIPPGGTGQAAGGWDTAANRDSAITSINAILTALRNIGLIS